jgi:hypothetical protein
MLIVQVVFWPCYIGLAALTFVGERRRGSDISVAVCAGLAFPATWFVWYARDRWFAPDRTRPPGTSAGALGGGGG